MFANIIDTINNKCDEYINFVFSWINNLPGLLKLGFVLLTLVVLVFGVFALIKKSFKLVLVVGIIACVVMLGWALLS